MADQKGPSGYEFKPENYASRVKRFYDDWENNKEGWKAVDAVVIVNGEADEEIIYKKSTALQSWLFGMEMKDTVVVITETGFHILTPQDTAEKLQFTKGVRIEGHDVSVQFLIKGAESNEDNFAQLINAIKQSRGGQNVGALPRDRALGAFAEGWNKALEAANFTITNVATTVANLFLVKDALELKLIRAAARISATVLKDILLHDIEGIIDEEKKETHSAIAERIEDAFADPTRKISKSLVKDTVESCYTPIIQSGGVYDLKPSAISNDDPLHFGTIICSVGARFKHYCSNVARTYFVDPDKEQGKNYAILQDVLELLVATLKPGVRLSKLWEVAKEHIQKTKPELEAHFLKTCGFGMGLEFRESPLTLNNKNTNVAQAGMVFNLCVGFHNLERKGKLKDPKCKTYSIMLADTVIVTDGEPERPTKICPSKWSEVAYFLEEDEEEEEKTKSKPSKASSNDDALFGRRSTRSREQDKSKEAAAAEEKRRKHQMELEKKNREEAEARFREAEGKGSDKKGRRQGDYVAYADHSQFPKDAKAGHIFVDSEKETVIMPVHGLLVPFHISTIKSATQSDDLIRINFITPVSNFIGTNKQPRVFKDTKSVFIREMTYRCPDKKNLTNALRLIKEIRKRHLSRVEEREVREGLVKQEELILNKGRVVRLTDLYVRPNIGGRRTTGALEVHKNGFRFRANKGGHVVDILFKNIKHAFFQPAEKELIVLIHFHLHDGIMIGKKKTQDIQVYTEVMEIAHNLDGRNRGMDRDDLDDELKERELRAKLNAEFHNFIKRVEDIEPGLEFDVPYRDLGFHGVPGRTNCFLMPTVHCLVQLIEPPFFVLTLEEVEIAHFERIQFSLRNFDLVFVFKDLTRMPATISAIPVQSLEPIKEWLDECNIKYYEGPTNLNWKPLLATIRKDPKKFWEDGGWNFLNTESSSDEEPEDEDVEDAYNPSDQEDEDDYEGSEDSAGDDYEEDEDEEEYEEDEEDDEGDDWDELERKAELADRKRGKYRDEPDDQPKRQRTNAGQAKAKGGGSVKKSSSASSARVGEKRRREH